MAIPTLGAMIAAIGSPAEWGAVDTAKLKWDDVNSQLIVVGTNPLKTTGSSLFAQTDNTNTAYYYAAIQLREAQYGASSSYLAPRISLHWGGVVASQISIDSSGRITILDNPGTGYEALICGSLGISTPPTTKSPLKTVLPSYANNAAAVADSCPVGTFYKCIVGSEAWLQVVI